jgi:hypothetical protein
MYENTTSLESKMSAALVTMRENVPREGESTKDTNNRREQRESQD